MVMLRRCCFWKDLSYPAAVGAMFTLGLSLLYIAIWISIWTNGIYPSNALLSPTSYPVINTLAIPVSLDTIEVLTAALALFGIATSRRQCIVGWLIYLPVYIIYQIVLLIILCIILAAFSDSQKGLLVTIVIFWIIQIIVNASSWLVTWAYFRQLKVKAASQHYLPRRPQPQSLPAGVPPYGYKPQFLPTYGGRGGGGGGLYRIKQFDYYS